MSDYSDEQFNAWVQAAEERWDLKLMDGSLATLKGVRKNTMSLKIMWSKRHYNIWVDDVALVRPSRSAWLLEREAAGLPMPSSSDVPSWRLLLPWQAPSGETPGTEHRLLRDEPSKHWLTVQPRPELLHPSFQPPAPEAEVIQLHPSK